MSPRAFARAVRRTQESWGARIIIKLDAAHPRPSKNHSFEAGSHVIGPRGRARQAKRWLRHNRALHGKWRRVALSCPFCPGRCQDLAMWPLGPAGSHGDSQAKPKGPERSCRCRKRTQLYWHQHDGHGSPPCLQNIVTRCCHAAPEWSQHRCYACGTNGHHGATHTWPVTTGSDGAPLQAHLQRSPASQTQPNVCWGCIVPYCVLSLSPSSPPATCSSIPHGQTCHYSNHNDV